jgi:hypothetical protein
MARLHKILREPLLHFLVLGAGLFLLFGGIGKLAEERPDQIVVTEAKIGNVAELFERTWRRPPTAAELDGLIEDHIKEEILYREALALGLERDDIVIRRRLRQKMEFLSEDVTPPAEPTEAELRIFLAEHADRFRAPWRVSFAQVYLSPERRGANVRSDAERLLVALNTGKSDPAEAGDPLLLEQDYRELAAQDVERLFGGAFAAQVAQLPVGRWSGPVESGYRLHLVLVREQAPASKPDLTEVREPVANEWRAAPAGGGEPRVLRWPAGELRVTVERPSWAGARPAAVAQRQ